MNLVNTGLPYGAFAGDTTRADRLGLKGLGSLTRTSLRRLNFGGFGGSDLREELDGGDLVALIVTEHGVDDGHDILDLVDGLTRAEFVLKLTKCIDRSLEGFDFGVGSDDGTGIRDGHAGVDRAGEEVEAVHL